MSQEKERNKDIRNSIVRSIQHLNTEQYTKSLSSLTTPATDQVDIGGYTIIHEIVLSNILQKMQIKFLKILHDVITEQSGDDAQEELKKYVNLLTIEDSRTALHIAVQNGQQDVVYTLIDDWQAELYPTNLYGFNVLHVAAMAGHAHLLVYLITEKNMDIYRTDKKGRTALHLAAHEGQTITLIILISLYKNIDIQDDALMTPLHAATLQNETRVVKHLLLNGASRNSRDYDNQTPLDMVKKRKQDSQEIAGILKNPNFCQKINPIKPPIGLLNRNHAFVSVYITAYLIRYAPFLIFTIPIVPEWAGILTFIIGFASITSFLLVSSRSPGYVTPKPHYTLLYLYEKYDGEFVCPYWVVKRGYSVRHWHYCKKCVRRYDHHCPWINNWVGMNNARYFQAFIILTELDFCWLWLMSILAFFKVISGPGLWKEVFNFPESDDFQIALWIFIFSLICFSIVFPLFFVTISNACKNTTTAERFGRKHKGTGSSSLKASLLSDQSDTASMLRIDEDDTLGFSNFTETMIKDSIDEGKSCYCWRKTQSRSVSDENNDSSFGFLQIDQQELQSEY